MSTDKLEKVKKLVPAFAESAKSTFETMVFLPLTVGEPKAKDKGQPTGYISGTISLTGDDQCGNLSLIFPMEMAKVVFRSMMGMSESDAVADAELNDVVGELANMVAGGAKSRLQELGINFKIGLPTVVVGNDHHLEPPKDAATLVIPCTTEKGVLHLELSI